MVVVAVRRKRRRRLMAAPKKQQPHRRTKCDRTKSSYASVRSRPPSCSRRSPRRQRVPLTPWPPSTTVEWLKPLGRLCTLDRTPHCKSTSPGASLLLPPAAWPDTKKWCIGARTKARGAGLPGPSSYLCTTMGVPRLTPSKPLSQHKHGWMGKHKKQKSDDHKQEPYAVPASAAALEMGRLLLHGSHAGGKGGEERKARSTKHVHYVCPVRTYILHTYVHTHHHMWHAPPVTCVRTYGTLLQPPKTNTMVLEHHDLRLTECRCRDSNRSTARLTAQRTGSRPKPHTQARRRLLTARWRRRETRR